MMRALVFAITAVFNVVFFHVGASSDEAQISDDCALLIKLLPEQLRDLSIRSCERPAHVQTRLAVQLGVPAARVQETERILVSVLAMKPLRFVCCGYETQPVTIPLPADHPLNQGVPNGAFRDASLSFFAPGISENTPELVIQKLGQADGMLLLELVDY